MISRLFGSIRHSAGIREERKLCDSPHYPNLGPPCSTKHAKNLSDVVALQSVIELSRTQDEEVGDGTTSSVIILG